MARSANGGNMLGTPETADTKRKSLRYDGDCGLSQHHTSSFA
jgi:hypothetical protein